MGLRCLSVLICSVIFATSSAETRLSVLFLGDHGHHRPRERADQLIPVLAGRGIDVKYVDKVEELNLPNLKKHDALIIYANHGRWSPDQEKALVDYVEQGGGFVPIHCASACWRQSQAYIDLVGGQFLRHGTGVFHTDIVSPKHPVMQKFEGFKTWDETYVHHKHNTKDRIVLQTRKERDQNEPWTWIRAHGKGRVFYTAYGHDHRTWGKPGFHALIEKGIRWSAGSDEVVEVPGLYEPRPEDLKPFQFKAAKIAYYPPGGRRRGDGKWNQMQLPVAPPESARRMQTPRGFKTELFASEPDIQKAICMAWDARGRLWVCETKDYPNEMQPEGKGRDQIKICEDTDGDGKADKFTVFVDKLSIPTSLTFANGGVIVHQAPHTLFFKDTNGDDKADDRKVLFSGWGTGDTHAGPSNLRYGFDNWIYGAVGYSGFNGTVGGEKHNFRMGIYRFKSDGAQLEFLRSTNNNTWGLGLSEENIVFASTANNNASCYMPIPNRFYEKVRGWSAERLGTIATSQEFYPITEKVRQVDAHGRFTAGAGHALYTARVFPKQYWNRTAFVNGPTGHLVGTFVLRERGSDFYTTNSWNLLASDDEWSAPIMTEVGPDGAAWTIDWYNYIVQHNPTPAGFKRGKGNAYETSVRDKVHGRVYRTFPKGAKLQEIPNLEKASPEELVATLKNPNMLWRMHAQRLLVERGKKDVAGDLVKLVEDGSVDDAGINAAAIHALWALRGLNAMNARVRQAAAKALKHSSRGVRRTAIMTLPRATESLQAILESGILNDRDGQVRMAACLALSEFAASADAGRAIVGALGIAENASDRWIPDALTSAASAHEEHFLAAACKEKLPGTAQALVGRIVPRVAEHFARGESAPKSVGNVVAALESATPQVAESIVNGLTSGWPKGRRAELSDEVDKAMVGLVQELSPAARGKFVKLAVQWGSKSFTAQMAKIAEGFLRTAQEAKKPESERIAAAGQFIEFRNSDAAAAASILALVTPKTSPELARGFIQSIGRSYAPEAGAALVAMLPRLTPDSKKEVLNILLKRSEWTASLLASAEEGKLSLSLLPLAQQQNLSRHPDRKLASRARKILKESGVAVNADRQKVIDRYLEALAGPDNGKQPKFKSGDAARGKVVLQQNCTVCHKHSGEGADIAPDLTGMNVHPKHELLIHILDPSRSVEGNFQQYQVATDEDEVFAGLLASESKTAIEIIDIEGKKHVILRENIETLIASPKSVMPEGFEHKIPEADMGDLLEFLTQRGKFQPLPLGKAATISSDRGMFHAKSSMYETLIFNDWRPKVFEGVPFILIDPKNGTVPNIILLHSPNGAVCREMPKKVTIPCNGKAKAIHLLSGIGGWNYPAIRDKSVSLTVRLNYDDGKAEDHPLRNGEEFADYIRVVHVKKSKFAYKMQRGGQVRYIVLYPKRDAVIKTIDFIDGDRSGPAVVAVTVEAP
ncbi:MAG: ThuA domain-containing protein [Planctomycetota bacterium]|nr:ThuA domain-containing protein [Planctomycetota bacterium]